MTLRIATPHQAARLAITLMKMREPQSPTTQSLPTMTKSSNRPMSSEENNLLNGYRDAFIINKLKPNSKSNIK